MVEYSVRRSLPYSLAQSAIGWATLVIIMICAIPYGGNSPAYWTLLSFLIIFLFALQIALGLLRGTPQYANQLLVPALLFLAALAWGYLQTTHLSPDAWSHPFWQLVTEERGTVSATPIAGLHVVLKLTAYAMVFWIALQASINSNRALAFVKGFALFSLVLAAFGLYSVISGTNVILQEQATQNVSATFINRNSYATYAVFGLVANLSIYMEMLRTREPVPESRHRDLRNQIERFFGGAWVFALGAVLCLSALLLTASRAGTAAGFAAVITFFILHRGQDARTKSFWLMILLLLGVFATSLSENVIGRVLTTDSDQRFIVYREMFAALDERLWLGHGLGAFQDTFRPYVPLEIAGAEWDLAHSTYLENLWEFGLPATIAFYGALFWVSAAILRGSLNRTRNRIFPIVAFACIVGAALHSMVDFSLQMPAVAAVFAFILGVGWAYAWPSSTRSKR